LTLPAWPWNQIATPFGFPSPGGQRKPDVLPGQIAANDRPGLLAARGGRQDDDEQSHDEHSGRTHPSLPHQRL
jgi:hypothetical protein